MAKWCVLEQKVLDSIYEVIYEKSSGSTKMNDPWPLFRGRFKT